MTKHHAITAQLDTATFDIVGRLAKSRGVTESEFVSEAIRRVAESEADFQAFIQAGIDAADRGELVSQEEMESWFDARTKPIAAE